MEIAGEKHLFFQCGPEGCDAVKLQRQPEPQASEVLGELGVVVVVRMVGGDSRFCRFRAMAGVFWEDRLGAS